jgi:hypothetical protein
MAGTVDAAKARGKARIAGFGDISFSFEGEHYGGKMQVCFNPPDSFSCECFDAFGSTIVSMAADSDSADIAVGDEYHRVSCDQTLGAVPYFRRFPFTFARLMRILTGRLPFAECTSSTPDSVWQRRRIMGRKWNCNGLDAVSETDLRRNNIKRVVFRAREPEPWALQFSGFSGPIARQIRFEISENNYFSVRFQKVAFGEITCLGAADQ